MSFSKTIQMFIFDGNPNGRIMCELSNWNGRVYKISRNELPEFSQRDDSENTGVYFLFGKNEENNDTVYIGEAGYPPVVKMGTDGLKITKTSFRNTLKYLLTEKKIA